MKNKNKIGLKLKTIKLSLKKLKNVSLPFSHPFLLEIVKFKTKKNKKIETFLQQEKYKLIQMEKSAFEKNKRISIHRCIVQ